MASGGNDRNAIGNRLLEKISGAEWEALEPHSERVTLELGEALITSHEPIRHVYFPINCLASLVTVLDDGSSIEAGTIGREGMVGIAVILGAGTTPMQTLVQVPGDAIRVASTVVKEVFGRADALQSLLHRYVHTLFVIASQSAACNKRHRIESRLARWLLMSSDGVGSDEIAITHEFLAVMLGVRRSGVTETALKLQHEGLIQYRRGGVRIADRRGLERVSCECYAVVKQEFERLFAEP